MKRPQSSRARNIYCNATIHLWLESWRLESTSHPLEVNIRFTHNHIIDSAESLSFRRVDDEVREKFLELFNDGHSPASALYSYQDDLHLSAADDQELLEILADRARNPDYNYVHNLFQGYREAALGGSNGKRMFERLAQAVNDYNSLDNGKAVLQEFDAYTKKAFILCIVTGLMSRVHEKVPQACEICYMDASASFEPLNTSITLLYTSCAVGALPLGLLITSDESEATLVNATILPPHAFYGRGAQTGPIIFLTDDSKAERNALERCWPQGVRLLCTFHVLQAFWRWLHDSKHRINKEDRISIMDKMKKILYAPVDSEMDLHYLEFKQNFYHLYPLLQKHFELLWDRRRFWALSFRSKLPIRGNNTNNYIERSFGILKDIIFARTQAFNSVQVFQFVTLNMERFYKRRLLSFAHRRPDYLYQTASRFLCPGWEMVDTNFIQRTNVESEFTVLSMSQDDLFYTVNSKIGACTCPVGMTGAPCKHQGAVAMKFNVAILNFLPSYTPDDRIVFTYIALGSVAKNNSFYASLRAGLASQEALQEPSQEPSQEINERLTMPSIVEWRDPNKETSEIVNVALNIFLEEIKDDFQNSGPQFRTAWEKFAERYRASKLISIPRLSSFLYDIDRNIDPTRVKSGAMIRVQVESAKRRKIEGSSGTRRRLPVTINEGKENLDPQVIPARKKKKTGKKGHDLSKNVLKNQPN